jgi:OOP family OmpA-OmpF porin
MKKLLYGCSAVVLASCAATSDQPSMSPEQLAECLQPNRRVVVEVVGLVAKPPAKKPAAKPQEAKPEAAKAEAAKPEADKPAADKPAPKPKVEMAPFEESAYVQGNDAFDRSSATLKPGGQKEIDDLLALVKKRAVQVNAVIVAGHSDRLEAKSAPNALSEDRAKAVKDYLVKSGINEKLIFWEGKSDTQPVAVTKFCN